MKISTLLNQAARCKTELDATNLLEAMKTAFGRTGALKKLYQANDEAYMEGTQPHVKFEMNKELSGFYITSISPEIREGALSLIVRMNFMLDGYGMQSQTWDLPEGMDEEIIEANPEQTVAESIKLALQKAWEHHATLIERLGVPPKAAMAAAKKSWKK